MPARLKIAVVMELDWPYKRHYETFAGIRKYGAEQGNWEFYLGNFPQVDLARGKKFDGIVGRIRPNCLAAAQEAGLPVVNVWIDSPVVDQVPGVQADFHAAGRLAAEHLIVRGLHRLAHIGFKKSLATKLHYQGMLEVAKEHGLSCESFTFPTDFEEKEKSWEQFVRTTIQMQQEWRPPVGVGFSVDELAHATATRFIEGGWRVPEDLALIGTNNELLICNAAEPSLSSIDMADRRCGYEAARLLDQLMRGGKSENKVQYIPPKELVLRGSSDAYAVEDPATLAALRYMAQSLGEKISVPDIAAAVGIGRQALERRFRQQLKRTVNDELIRLRISKMKQLLVETDETVGVISDSVGFGTTANMHVMFKRQTGLSPLRYREKHGQEKF